MRLKDDVLDNERSGFSCGCLPTSGVNLAPWPLGWISPKMFPRCFQEVPSNGPRRQVPTAPYIMDIRFLHNVLISRVSLGPKRLGQKFALHAFAPMPVVSEMRHKRGLNFTTERQVVRLRDDKKLSWESIAGMVWNLK